MADEQVIQKVSTDQVINNDIGPDGVPTGKTSAAPLGHRSSQSQPSSEKTIDSIKDLQKLDKDGTIIVDDGQQHQAKNDDKTDGAIDINDFINAGAKAVPAPKVDTKVEKVDDKEKQSPTQDDTAVIDGKKKDDVQQQQQVSTEKDADKRDYTNIDEAYVPLFKRMSNEAFDKLKPVYLENKKLKTDFEERTKELEDIKKNGPKIPENYYEHPNAFILTPEFTSALQSFNDSQLIYNHWTKQLDAVAAGEKEIEMLALDQRTGQYYVSGKVEANRQVENKLNEYKSRAERILAQNEGRLEAVKQTFTERFQQSKQQIEQMESQYFAGLTNEQNKASYEPIIKDTYNKLPANMKGANGMFIAKSLTMITTLASLLKQAAAEQQSKAANGNGNGNGQQQQQRLANPSGGEIAGDGGRSSSAINGKEISLDDFNAVKGGY